MATTTTTMTMHSQLSRRGGNVATLVREEVVVDKAVPHGLHGTNARSEELAKVPCLPARCPDDTGHPILDVPCRRVPVDVVDIEVVVVVDVVVVGGVCDGSEGGCHCGGEDDIFCCVGVVRLCGVAWRRPAMPHQN